MKLPVVAMACALLVAVTQGAPAATVADLEFRDPLWGEPVEPDSLKGRVVAVYFWAAD